MIHWLHRIHLHFAIAFDMSLMFVLVLFECTLFRCRPHMRELDSDVITRSRVVIDCSSAVESGDLYVPLHEKLINETHIVGRLGQFITLDETHKPFSSALVPNFNSSAFLYAAIPVAIS